MYVIMPYASQRGGEGEAFSFKKKLNDFFLDMFDEEEIHAIYPVSFIRISI